MKRRELLTKPITLPYGSEMLDEKDLGTETEAEKQMKHLLEKQLNTEVTLQGCLAHKQSFVNCSTFTPLTELIEGTCSLRRYKEVENKEEKHQELQRCGLSEDEIAFYLYHTAGNPTSSRKRTFVVEPSVENAQLTQIQRKIENHQKELEAPEVFSGVRTLTRHAMDIEKTLYVGCRGKESLKHLVLERPNSELEESDPFKHIRDLSLAFNRNMHKRRKQQMHIVKVNDVPDDDDNPVLKPFVYDPNVHHVIVPLEEEQVAAKRLSIEEIREIPRFKEYNPGIASKVLYLKNLHPKVNVRELQSLFSRFEMQGDKCIDYNMLTGRMRGQAFITFPDIATAVKALQFVNGYVLRQRPIVIEYGKKS